MVHRGVRLYDIWCSKNGFPVTEYNVSPTAWVEELIFFDWFSSQFLLAIESIKPPVLLIYDGHYNHISIRTIKMTMDNGVQIECLPPHTMTILKLLGIVTRIKVKIAWRQLLRKRYLRTNSALTDRIKFTLLVKASYKLFLNKIVICIIDRRIMGKAFVKVALSKTFCKSRDLSL